MSNVTLRIAGRRYTLACAEGEEEHVTGLGMAIDARLDSAPGVPRQSETQTLLFAALLLADELHENGGNRQDNEHFPAEAIVGSLEKLAERLESVAAELEGVRVNA